MHLCTDYYAAEAAYFPNPTVWKAYRQFEAVMFEIFTDSEGWEQDPKGRRRKSRDKKSRRIHNIQVEISQIDISSRLRTDLMCLSYISCVNGERYPLPFWMLHVYLSMSM